MSLLVLVSCVSGAVAVWIRMCACRCRRFRVGLAVFGPFLAVGGIRLCLVCVVVVIVLIGCWLLQQYGMNVAVAMVMVTATYEIAHHHRQRPQ